MTVPTEVEAVLAGERWWAMLAGDGLALARSLPDRSCVVICDPPYDERTHAGTRETTGKVIGRLVMPFAPLESTDFVVDLLRVSRSWVLCFCALEQFGSYATSAGPRSWVRACIWHRPNSMGCLTNDRPATACEGVAVMHRRGAKKSWNGGGKHGFWSHLTAKGNVGDGRYHPTAKPVALMAELIALFTSPEDVVFDPFAGSGTTGIAAVNAGRRFVGAEIRPAAHAEAVARLEANDQGLSLRAARSGQCALFGAGGV